MQPGNDENAQPYNDENVNPRLPQPPSSTDDVVNSLLNLSLGNEENIPPLHPATATSLPREFGTPVDIRDENDVPLQPSSFLDSPNDINRQHRTFGTPIDIIVYVAIDDMCFATPEEAVQHSLQVLADYEWEFVGENEEGVELIEVWADFDIEAEERIRPSNA
jgi:hypothetical protein